MNINNTTIHCLKKINHAAKLFAALKQAAYDNGEHEKVREYKRNQVLLYLVKSLTLLDLEKSGEIKRMQRVADKKTGYLLQEFSYDLGDGTIGYIHSPSFKQEVEEGEEVGTYFGRGNQKIEEEAKAYVSMLENKEISVKGKRVIYLPYLNYLIKRLSPEYKMIYDFISEDLSPTYGEKVEEFLDFIKEHNVKGEVLDSFSWYNYNRYKIALYCNDIKLCIFEIYINENNPEHEDLIIIADDEKYVCAEFAIFLQLEACQYA